MQIRKPKKDYSMLWLVLALGVLGLIGTLDRVSDITF